MTEAEKAYQYFVIAVPENEEQAKAYFWARKALQPTLTPPNEWVSVEERLPEDYQRVLCLFESGTMEVSFRASVKGFCYEGFKQTGKVTHWMPLPEPPKEE